MNKIFRVGRAAASSVRAQPPPLLYLAVLAGVTTEEVTALTKGVKDVLGRTIQINLRPVGATLVLDLLDRAPLGGRLRENLAFGVGEIFEFQLVGEGAEHLPYRLKTVVVHDSDIVGYAATKLVREILVPAVMHLAARDQREGHGLVRDLLPLIVSTHVDAYNDRGVVGNDAVAAIEPCGPAPTHELGRLVVDLLIPPETRLAVTPRVCSGHDQGRIVGAHKMHLEVAIKRPFKIGLLITLDLGLRIGHEKEVLQVIVRHGFLLSGVSLNHYEGLIDSTTTALL